MAKIKITVSEKWIYGGDGSNSIRIKKYFSELAKALEDVANVTMNGINVCVIELKKRNPIIVEKINDLADKYLPDLPEDNKDIFSFTVEDDSESEEKEEPDTEENYDDDDDGPVPYIDFINDLIGLDDFKKYCNEIDKSASIITGRKLLFFGEALLCVADDGNGFDENLGLFASFLQEYGLNTYCGFEKQTFGSYFDKREDFPNLQINNNHSSIYVFDIRGYIGNTNDDRFKNALRFIFDTNKKNLIIFRMGNRSKSVIEDTVRDIEDIINVRLIEFPHFSDEQLYSYAKQEFKSIGFEPDENTFDVFKNICDYEKEDGLFYGINTVKKVVGEMARVSLKAGSEKVIDSEACKTIVPERADTEDTLKIIEDMIGMEDVARQMREIIAQVIFSRANGTKSPAMHMLFVGNPGTGKTTVARALGQIFRENHILRAGKFFEHKGRDLCGEYVGHTAVKVNNICKSAYGSVLFIDEAYSLATDRREKDYGKEAIDTLIAEMENHSDDLVVIFAGYPDEMEYLLDTNPGMRSRIPYKIVFPDYSKEQLYQIYMKMVENSGYSVADGFSDHVKEYFLDLPDELLESKQFGNARFVRNIFERTWGKAILRCPAGSYEVPPLEPGDFDAATVEFKSLRPTENKKIGF